MEVVESLFVLHPDYFYVDLSCMIIWVTLQYYFTYPWCVILIVIQFLTRKGLIDKYIDLICISLSMLTGIIYGNFDKLEMHLLCFYLINIMDYIVFKHITVSHFLLLYILIMSYIMFGMTIFTMYVIIFTSVEFIRILIISSHVENPPHYE
jgi:hypothetical protein